METRHVTEGAASIDVPEGEMTRKDAVFFNPDMKFNRDVSLAFLKIFSGAREKMFICDLLAGSGIRGIRYALEVPGIDFVVLNDINPQAAQAIRKNVSANNVTNAVVENMDGNLLLSMHPNKLDFVDVDPFGSPAMFVDSAARAIKHCGFLGVTATDLGPLAGTNPKTCMRRYGAKPVKNETMHETGVRILLGYLIRTLSKYDKAFIPTVSFASEHYYRIMGEIRRSRSMTDRMLSEINFMLYCRKCGNKEYSQKNSGNCECGAEYEYAGPLYSGNLFNADAAKKIEATDSKVDRFKGILIEEAECDGMLYDVHELCSRNRLDTVKIESLIKRIKESGAYKASRSVFGGSKIRTNAPSRVIVEAIKSFGAI